MRADDPANHPQNSPAKDGADQTLTTGSPGGAAAGQIGPYRLLQLLGEGGMGEVWLAEQKQPIHRTVALKLIKAGMDTKAVVARFESERQALALMDHPNIARVFEAGATPEGRPYFVMEYVPGPPITEYCDKRRLTLNERLELFLQVCDGVQHAHQKAIIHRDLKPSNVLVVERDNKAIPKIIDFGLAKATAQRLTEKTMFTEFGVLLGTPEYMSPEQADLQEQNLDTRTDVYSLGVIFYQLLVGVVPFEAKALRSGGLEAILRVIREQDPSKPSTKVRSMGNASNASAEKRKEEPRSFARHLQGELDWITMKALEKDRTQRYGSPAEFGADIQRRLRNEPVIAHPPSAGYRARKYIRRHRLGVAVVGAGVAILIAFAIVQTVQLRRITRERDRADRITEFMTGMFKVSGPSESRGYTVTAREILDKASKQVDSGLSRDPELQAKMMYTMAGTYYELGLYSRAQPLLERAIEIQTRVLGPRNPDTLDSKYKLASLLKAEGHASDAVKLEREILEQRRRVLGPQHRKTLASLALLGATLYDDGHYAEAEKLEREAFELDRRVLGPEDLQTLGTEYSLAAILMQEKHSAEGTALIRETFDIRSRILGPEDQSTIESRSQLSGALLVEGRYDEAEKIDRGTLEIQRRILGPEHPETLNAMSDLAETLQDEHRYAEAEKLHRDTLALRVRILGPEHPSTLTSMHNLAVALQDEGKFAEAEALDRQTIEIQRRVLGPEHPDTLFAIGELADILRAEGRYAEAEKVRRETLDIDRKIFGNHDPTTLSTLESMGIDLSYAQRYGDAEKMFRDAIQAAGKPNESSVLALAWYNFACGAAVAGHRDDAFGFLGQALDLGYPPGPIASDEDLKSLRSDARFDALIAHAKERAAAGPTSK